jgi:hypothetical protein
MALKFRRNELRRLEFFYINLSAHFCASPPFNAHYNTLMYTQTHPAGSGFVHA